MHVRHTFPSSSRKNRAAPAWRAGRWAFYGALLGMALTLVLFMPARWLAYAIAQASQSQLQLVNARGTVWNGSAQLMLTGGAQSRDATTLPGRMQWQLRPRWMGASLALLPECCATAPLQGTLQVGWQRFALQLENHRSQWPSSLLEGLGAPWNTLKLNGQLSVQLDQFSLAWNNGRLRLEGKVIASLQNATSSLTTVRPMGSYQAVLQGGDAPTLQLLTDKGPLHISGQGQWSAQHLRFHGQASTDAEHLAALSNLLSLLGRREGATAILSF